jgi:periplasmic protein TonB
VRIVWITAILAGVLAILMALLSGTKGGDSSSGSHQAASAPGFAFEAQERSESAKTEAPRDDRNEPANGQTPAESDPSSDAPSGSADQPGDAGVSEPVVTPQPAPRPKVPPPPRLKLPPPPPPAPVSSQPPPPEPVQPSVNVANNNDGP